MARPWIAVGALLVSTAPIAVAQETITPLASISLSQTTGEKPQSKLWFHAGHWWAVLPSTAVSPTGTWVWRLDADNRWRNVLRLSSNTTTRADVKTIEDLTHVFLYSTSPQLVSIEYVPSLGTYRPWSVRPTATSVTLSGSEIATVDVDSLGRMWLSSESGTNIVIRHSDPPYSTFSSPLVVANNINDDDISVVVALPVPVPRMGVFWSNQNTQRFGFRFHVDTDPPDLWSRDELPASQSALRVNHGMADDHMHAAFASDGTLFIAAKTSYDTSGFPVIVLLVRRPNGTWDNLYQVDTLGTRPIVLLNEPANLLRVIYTSSTAGGNILYRDSLISTIGFGARRTLMTGTLNNATSTKMNWTDQLAVMASGKSVLLTRPTLPPSTTTTTTTIPPGLNATIDADVSVVVGDATASGKTVVLDVDGSPTAHSFIQFTVSGSTGHVISSAILRLRALTQTDAQSDSKGRVHVSTCGWNEATLTGTTQPQPPIGSLLDAPAGSVAQGQVVDFNVTGAITHGDGTYCLALDTNSSNAVRYTAREAGAGGPAIRLTASP